MRHRWFIFVAVLLLAMVGGAVAAFAYDSSRDDLIAEGVTIAGVDVGGMTTAEARAVVQRELQSAALFLCQRKARGHGRNRGSLPGEQTEFLIQVGQVVGAHEPEVGSVIAQAIQNCLRHAHLIA